MSTVPPESEAARRLHPTTLVQRLVVSIPGFVLASLPFWTGTNGVPFSLLFIAFFAAVYLLVAVPMAILRYLRFRYWLTPREIIVQSGVLTRQHRSIPLERVQNVEIRQPLIARLFRTARVQIETAGSTTAEGQLEFVSLREAQEIRRIVREFKREVVWLPLDETEPTGDVTTPPVKEEDHLRLLEMPVWRVLLSGVYRFSLLYILIIFSGIQYLNVEPDAILDWFTGGALEPVTHLIGDSPWLAALLGVLVAALFSWIVGIAVNLNRFYGFRLAREGDKLYRRHGLLTVLEGTIPLKKVQAAILRANMLMRRHGWVTLKLQTMGVDPDQRGAQIAVPFARKDEVLAITPEILPFDLPEHFERVSKLTIRRMTIRYTVMLLAATLIGWTIWNDFIWLLVAWPLLPLAAYLQYLNHGYAFDGERLFVRRGVLVHRIWVLPTEKFQVLFSNATLFQRRLRLSNVLVDMAGASSARDPAIVDLPSEVGSDLMQRLHRAASGARARKRFSHCRSSAGTRPATAPV